MCTNSSFGTCVPGRYIAVGLSSGVAVKRGSTVLLKANINRRYRMCNYFVAEFSLARYGVTFANNSVIDINLVGEGYPGITQTYSGALECHTDDITCCRGIDHNPNGTGRGEWYYPDGTMVSPPGGDGFYRARDHMVIRLNRGGTGTLSQTGMFRCVIPGAGGIIITRYIQLGIRCMLHRQCNECVYSILTVSLVIEN